MKKTIIMLCLVALVVIMAVPAFAAEIDGDYVHNFGGVYSFPDDLPIQIDRGHSMSYEVEFTYGGRHYSGLTISRDYSSNDFDLFAFPDSTDLSVYDRIYNSYIGWYSGNIIVFDEGQSVEYALYYIVSNYSLPPCDGSICPATDVNQDNICDNCGQTIYKQTDNSTGGGTTYVDYNGVSLPSIDTVWIDKETYKACIIFKDKGSDTYHLVYGSYYYKDYLFTETSLTGNPAAYCSISNWTWYDLVDDQWTFNTTGTNNVICRVADYDLIWANQTIYTDSTRETPFFQLPPVVKAPTLAEVISQETLAGALTEVIAILPAGLVCLIGYLALRKALKILRAVLYQA